MKAIQMVKQEHQTEHNKNMEQSKYLKTLLEGSGHLNSYSMKTSDKSPDCAGYLKLGGKIYRISAWEKVTSTGKKTISLKAFEANPDGSFKYPQ